MLYPELCVGCSRPLFEHEALICTPCWYNLPETNFHKDPSNMAARQLWGRVKLENVTAYLYFIKASAVQSILHHLKYLAKPEIGELLGAKYGAMLKDSVFSEATVVIPVPLHSKKLKKRGYNQSVHFAYGLTKELKLPIFTDCLMRSNVGDSQTSKKRFERYENMKEVFYVINPERLINQHVLLVDDVLTTGATIEACANVLLEVPGVKISVVTLAFTK